MTIAGRVPPFGHPRINAYSQLPAAFRSVSRPSSPLIAKASSKCPYLSLDSYNINISLALLYLYLLSQQKSTRSSLTEKLLGVYFYTSYLDFF